MRDLKGVIWSYVLMKGLPYYNIVRHGSNKDDLFIHKGLKFSSLYFLLRRKEVQWLVGWLVVELENRVGKAWDLENKVSSLLFPLESLHSNPYITLNLKLSPCSLGQSLITAFLLILRFSKTTWAMELLANSRAPSNTYPNKGKQTHTHTGYSSKLATIFFQGKDSGEQEPEWQGDSLLLCSNPTLNRSKCSMEKHI